jgi:hypothetical protein
MLLLSPSVTCMFGPIGVTTMPGASTSATLAEMPAAFSPS